jgi:hypothetical protein
LGFVVYTFKNMLSTTTLPQQMDYIDPTVSVFTTIVTQQVAALRDAESPEGPMDLLLGAADNIHLMVGGSNALDFQKKSAFDDTTVVTSTNNAAIEIQPGDANKTIVLGSLTVQETSNAQVLSTSKSELKINDNLRVTGSGVVTRDLLTQGAVIGSSLNMLRDFNDKKIGFGFRISDTSNLELYKYDNIANATQRVLVFGRGQVSGTGMGTTTAFPVFGAAESNVIGNNTTFGTGTSTFSGVVDGDLTVKGNTTVYGHILPASNIVYDLGSSNQRFRDLYLSGNTINIGSNTISVNEQGQIDAGSNLYAQNFIGLNLTCSNVLANSATLNTLNVTGTLNAVLDTNTVQIGTNQAQFVNIGTSTLTQTINIGNGSGTTTINIGGAGDTINISGTLTTVNTSNTTVRDNRITLNKGGAAGSGGGAGFTVEEDENQQGEVMVTDDRLGWKLKAPATAGRINLYPGATGFDVSAGNMWTAQSSNVVRATGGVAIGKATAAYPLDVAGDINFTGQLRSNGALVSFATGGGNATGADNYTYKNITTANTYQITNTGDTLINEFTCTITPTSASAEIELSYMINCEVYRDSIFQLNRNGSKIATPGNNIWQGTAPVAYDGDDSSSMAQVNIRYVDTPNTISPVTYTLTARTTDTGAAGASKILYLNRTASSAGSSFNENAVSHVLVRQLGGVITVSQSFQSSNTVVYLPSGSNLAIGKTTASYPLDVVGDINFTGQLRSNGQLLSLSELGGANESVGAATISHAYWYTASNVTGPNYIGRTTQGVVTVYNSSTDGISPLDTSSGLFNCRYTGVYQCNMTTTNAATDQLNIFLYKNDARVSPGSLAYGNVNNSICISLNVHCNAGDTLGFYVTSGTAQKGTDGSTQACAIAFMSSGGSQFTTSTSNVYLATGSNLGIGTSNPETLLDVSVPTQAQNHVVEAMRVRGFWASDAAMGSGAGALMRFTNNVVGTSASNPSSNQYNLAGIAGMDTRGDYSGNLVMYTAPAVYNGANLVERMRIDHMGNVGIGTSNPTQRLQVAGVVQATSFYSTDYSAYLQPSSVNGNYFTANGNTIYRTVGLVGLGVSDPIQRLEVNGNLAVGHRWNSGVTTTPVIFGKPSFIGDFVAGSAYISFIDSSTDGVNKGTSIGIFTHTWGGGTNEHARFAANGAIGLGTSTPSQKLHVIGNILATGTITPSSDDRLKSEEEIITNATETLLKLRPQTYKKKMSLSNDYVAPSGDQDTSNVYVASNAADPETIIESGLIAQEVYYDAPELRHLVVVPKSATPADTIVSSEDPSVDPDYSSWGNEPAALNYMGLIPYLIAGFKELKQENDDLKTRITALEKN